ncbi:alpha/beta hydrolase [Rhodococcus sp. UNC363MFTsu5.1]|uniref:alpha/beta hydrolase n=1 Tax=Rhodococcus sp. UNC363MFTsu5.1 TaxID=1449069 RepID=UPI00068C1532|nr:alpha/beta hydrolase [Rhodococcus sp. UNC363MFTsu5.1]
MTRGFLIRQAVNAALTANALRPVPGMWASVPAFVAGWLTSELAPQQLGATVLDAGVHLARHGASTRSDRLGLALAAVSAAGLTAAMVSSRRAGQEMADALREIGVDDPGAGSPIDWRSSSRPFRMRRDDVARVSNIEYAPGGARFRVDVYHHRDLPPNAPMLLQIHGGGWVIGSKDHQGLPLMVELASRGWVCAAVNYPLSPRASWPAHLIALKQAVAWLRTNGEQYGGDPDFLAVTGGSAGGHLAAMVALTANDPELQPGFEDVDTSVSACVPMYGAYDFAAETGIKQVRARVESRISEMVLGKGARFPEDYLAASPLAKLRADAPPFLVVHGTHDSLLPVTEAREFVARLRAISTSPVAYAELRGAQHAFDIFHSIRSDQVIRAIAAFLESVRAGKASGVEPAERPNTELNPASDSRAG